MMDDIGALKLGIKAYSYGISVRDSHSEILGQIGQWGSMFWCFQTGHLASERHKMLPDK